MYTNTPADRIAISQSMSGANNEIPIVRWDFTFVASHCDLLISAQFESELIMQRDCL
jgi:hypothetical protein